MGVAAYNRGSQLIRAQLQAEQGPVEFEIMERLNAVEKYPDCGRPPWPTVGIQCGHHGEWWIMHPTELWASFGYYYPSLEELMRRWNIDLTGYDASRDLWTGTRRP